MKANRSSKPRPEIASPPAPEVSTPTSTSVNPATSAARLARTATFVEAPVILDLNSTYLPENVIVQVECSLMALYVVLAVARENSETR